MKGISRDTARACIGFGRRKYPLSKVVELAGGNRGAVKAAMRRLVLAGLVGEAGVRREGRRREFIYKNADMKGLEGQLAQTLKNDVGWDRLWKAARVLRRFRLRDLADVTGEAVPSIRSFLYRYRDAGYFRSSGLPGRESQWSLANDPGPKRPAYG